MTIIHPDNNVLAHDESHYLSADLPAPGPHSLSHNPADKSQQSPPVSCRLRKDQRIKCSYWVRFETQWPPVTRYSRHLVGNTLVTHTLTRVGGKKN